MTVKNLTLENIEKTSAANIGELYDFNYETEKYFRTNVETKCDEFRLKDTGELIRFDYADRRVYDQNYHDLPREYGDRLTELGLVHPGSLETDSDLAELIAATDYRPNGCVENVVFEDDNIDSEDGE